MSKAPPFRFSPIHAPRANSAGELLDIAVNTAHVLFDTMGEIMPTFMFDNLPGKYTSVMHTIWRDNHEKHQIAHSVRRTLGMLGLTRYAIITESWFATIPAEGRSLSDAMRTPGPMPSERPDRKEAVIIIVHENGCTQPFAKMLLIERQQGKPPILREDKDLPTGAFVDSTFGPLDRKIS